MDGKGVAQGAFFPCGMLFIPPFTKKVNFFKINYCNK